MPSQAAILDAHYMARALELARKGLYTTHPNPRVGCVIVRDGEVVGEGWHMRAGEPHAEVHALRQAGELARGACAYVTLEPCSHHGRTPPCAEALVKAGVARVVAAMQDPNPQVAGQACGAWPKPESKWPAECSKPRPAPSTQASSNAWSTACRSFAPSWP